MSESSYRTLMRSDGFGLLIMFCGGVWLFAADELILATLIPSILADIGGANLVGLAGALFEAAAIVAGALSAFLVRKRGMHVSFTLAAAGFSLGCFISAAAPTMAVFQLGRFVQAIAGGGLIALTFIGVRNLFGSALMARAMGVISVVWGFAAFSGPLVGGLAAEFATWRAAFTYAGVLSIVLAVIAGIGLGRHPAFRRPDAAIDEDFPLLRIVLLFAGVMSLACAGITISPVTTPLLLAIGAVLVAAFIVKDTRSGVRRLLPRHSFGLSGRVGPALYAVMFLSAANMGTQLFSPVLIATLYDWRPLMIGFAMFLGSLGWTLAAATLSGTPETRERLVIGLGFACVTIATLGFNAAFHLDAGPLLWVSFFTQGAGFGAAWTFVVRRATKHPVPTEADRISAAFPTMQRAGLALGAAGFGIVANMNGFSESMPLETARTVAYWLVGLAVPVATIGLMAALQFLRAGEAESVDPAEPSGAAANG